MGVDAEEKPLSRPVGRILSEVGELTQMQRAELFSRLGIQSISSSGSNVSS